LVWNHPNLHNNKLNKKNKNLSGKLFFKSIKINSTIKNNYEDISKVGNKKRRKEILNLVENNKKCKNI
jgi:hypothetical protein